MTKDIVKTINKLKELVRNEGYLIFSETILPETWLLVSQALMMTPPEDTLRDGAAFISKDLWCGVLKESDGVVIAVGVLNNSVNTDKCIYEINSVMKPGGILLIIETVEDVPDILITQSFMMTEPKDQRKATNTMFLNRKQWLEILEENGFCNSEEFPGYGEYLEVLGQKLFYCTKE